MISIISMVYAAINHKRIRAKCCGRSVDFEINIDPTEAAAEEKTGAGVSANAGASLNLETRERRTIGADTLRQLRNLELFTKKTSKVTPEPAVIKPVAVKAKPRTWVDDDVEGLADDQDDVELGHHR